MIIDIKQIKHNLEFKFEISIDGVVNKVGQCSRFHSVLSNDLYDVNGELLYKTKYSAVTNIKNKVPLKWLWSKRLSDVHGIVDRDNNHIGRIQLVEQGFLYSYHKIEWFDDEIIIYSIGVGNQNYYMIKLNDVQIGMIVKDNSKIKNNLDTYRLYLLDEYSSYATAIELYILYYDSNFYSRRNEVVAVKYEKSWNYTYSRTDKYFDSKWLKDKFGLEEIDFKSTSQKSRKYISLSLAFVTIIFIIIIYLKLI